ncbi:hypothetical protein Tco_0736908 [Tanacetum coccineum]
MSAKGEKIVGKSPVFIGQTGGAENSDYPELIWEDLAYQIDHMNKKRSRLKNMPFPRFTKMFIKYSTGQIPPKKSRGKGSQRKKTTDNSQETVDVSKESEPEPEPVKRKTSSKRRVKKKVTLFAYDNIISNDPDTALELGKSISKTEAEKVEAARQVHATYARIVMEFVPEPTKIRKSSKVTSDPPKKLKGVPSLTLKEQEAADIMQALKERKKTRKRQPDDIYKYKIRVRKHDDEEMYNVKVNDSDKGDEEITDVAKADAEKPSELKDDPKKAKLSPTSFSLSVSLGFGNQFLKLSFDSSLVSTVKDTTDAEINLLLEVKIHTESPSIAIVTTLPPPSISTTPFVPQQTITPIPTPTITTDAPTITTAVSESDALSTVKLRVAKLEKDVSDLKKIDLSAKALVALKTQVPSVQIPELQDQDTTVDLEQKSEKSASEILKIKREQAKKQKMPKFTIKSTDKAALQEYDQKAFSTRPCMQTNKGVADTIQDHKRKHDDDEDDDDEEPLAGPNQGKALSKGSKTGKSALAKEPVEEPIAEVVMDDVGNDVVYDDDQPQDDSEPKTTKTPNLNWFKQPPRPPTLDPEWNKRQVVLDQPEHPWFNQMVSATKDHLTFDNLMATLIDFSNIELEYHFQECFNALTNRLDWNNLEGDRYLFDLSKPFPLQSHPGHLTVATDYFFNNDLEYLKSSDPKRTYTTSITKTKATQYEIKGRKLWQRSQLNKFSKHNVYSTKKNLRVKSVSVKKLHGYGHLEEIVVKRADRQFYKFKEGDLVDLHLNDIEDMLLLAVQHKLFHLTDSDIVDFIVALHMFTRSLVIKKRVEDLQLGIESYQKKLNIIPPQQTFLEIEFKELYTPSHNPPGMRERRIIRNLERLVGAWELEMDYKLMTQTITPTDRVRDSLVITPFHDDPYKLVRQAYTPVAIDTKSEPLEDPIETKETQSLSPKTAPISPDYTLASPDYTLDTPHSDEESEPIEASETNTTSPSDFTLPLSPDHPLTLTSPTPTPSRVFYYHSTARMVMHTQPILSLGISARVTEAASLSPSSFRKRYRSFYETPSSSPSPASSLTLPIRKRYQGTYEPILDTETEDDESEAEGIGLGSEELEDEGPGSEGKEAASEQQQQAVPVEDTTTDEPLGLGYRAARCHALELVEDPMPSMFEVGQSSRSVPDQQRADETHRIPTHPTWVHLEDGTIYIDIEIDPRSRAPVQTPASPEWSSGSLPVSPASLIVPLLVVSPVTTLAATIVVEEDEFIKVGAQLELHGSILQDHTQRLDALPPTLLEGMDQDITKLNDRSAAVRGEIHS